MVAVCENASSLPVLQLHFMLHYYRTVKMSLNKLSDSLTGCAAYFYKNVHRKRPHFLMSCQKQLIVNKIA